MLLYLGCTAVCWQPLPKVHNRQFLSSLSGSNHKKLVDELVSNQWNYFSVCRLHRSLWYCGTEQLAQSLLLRDRTSFTRVHPPSFFFNFLAHCRITPRIVDLVSWVEFPEAKHLCCRYHNRSAGFWPSTGAGGCFDGRFVWSLVSKQKVNVLCCKRCTGLSLLHYRCPSSLKVPYLYTFVIFQSIVLQSSHSPGLALG